MLNIKKIKPLNDSVITTMDKYADDVVEKGLINATKKAGSLKEYQTVVAVGPLVREIKVGDLVCINPRAYAQKKFDSNSIKEDMGVPNPVVTYNFNVIELDNVLHLHLKDRDIDFIVEEMEEIEESKLVQVSPLIV